MLKTYQSKKFINRSINITVDGKERVITFTGGLMYPKKVCGVYSTGSLKEQNAIESHPGLGSKFILLSEEKPEKQEPESITILEQEQVEETQVREQVKEIVEESNVDTTEEVQEDEPEILDEEESTEEVQKQVEETQEEEVSQEIKEIFEVEKVQEAKEWLMEHFPNEFTHRSLSNKEKILQAAKEKKVSFPNIA